MIRCIACHQEATWQAYVGKNEVKGVTYCSECKPRPWTSGSPSRNGVYFRPIKEEGEEEVKTGDFEPMTEEEDEMFGAEKDDR
jgi:NAD-dependent SIR2 family protein deacetylase